jgi:glycerol-3-phosphate acyltransferase PlsY
VPDLLGGFEFVWPIYAVALAAYLIGTIPFGLFLTRLAGLGELRDIGSGNIGATNVLRTGRKGLAAATLVLDGAKGTLPVAAAGIYGPDYQLVAGAAVVVGHVFPVWLWFRGGKGVATTLGVLFGLTWPIALLACAVWLAVALILRYSSLAAIIALPLAPLALYGMLALQRGGQLPYWLPGAPQDVTLLAAIAALVILRHHANIVRLLRGQEPRIGQGRG